MTISEILKSKPFLVDLIAKVKLEINKLKGQYIKISTSGILTPIDKAKLKQIDSQIWQQEQNLSILYQELDECYFEELKRKKING